MQNKQNELVMSCPIVAYIAYKPFGIDYLKNFLKKYSEFDSGEKHRLLVCFKGFSNSIEVQEWKSLIKNDFIEFYEKNEENDFDIGSYFRIADEYKDSLILFLNTYTKINCKNWLKIFLENYKDKRFIGYTGSYASIPSQFFGFYHSQYSKFQQLRWGINHFRKFKLFPNPHVRTNGFLIKGIDLISLNFDRKLLKNKIETNYFESGRQNITIQLQKKGFEVGIVNSDSIFFEVKRWKESDTYCLNNQEKLIFTDNRTSEYQFSNLNKRAKMTKFCWGI